MNKGTHYSQSVTSIPKIRRHYFFPILFLPLLLAFIPTNEKTESAPPSMMCADPEPIVRWNRLTTLERDALNDGDISTNVSGFHSGYCNGLGDPITIDISATGAPSTGNNLLVNNEVPSRWGMSSFNNERSDAGNSGNRYCFEFSEPVAVELSSEEHAFFHDFEQIKIEASVSGFSVNLDGVLGGDSGPAVINGSGTPNLHFDAQNQTEAGGWWTASTNGVAVDIICVEYYATASATSETGAEPFTLSICGADLCLDDADVTEVSFFKETICSEQAESGTPGNMDVTFRMIAVNEGMDDLGNLQITDNLSDYFPPSAFIGLKNIEFAPLSDVAVNPTLNLGFNGSSSKNLFVAPFGLMEMGDTLAIDLTVELDANAFLQSENITNQAFFWATGSSDNLVTAASDAPDGAPGDTGGNLDPLGIHIPAINLAIQVLDFAQMPGCGASGEVEVTLEVRYQNTGNATVDNLNLDADLESMLGSAFVGIVDGPFISFSTASQNPNFNPNYNGSATNDNLFNGISGRLEQGEVIHIQIRLRLDPNALASVPTVQFSGAARGLDMNSAVLPGCHDDDAMWAYDLSDAGIVPESVNATYIGHVDFHDDPLPLNLPNVGLAKEVSIFSPAASHTPGNMDVRFRLKMKNTGNVDLENIELLDDISAQFGDAFVAVVQMPTIVSSTATSAPGFGFFPGVIFDGGSGILEPNQEITVEFVVEMNPDAGAVFPITNQAETSAEANGFDGNPTTISALSDSGDNPESTNPNEPGDTGCSNDATFVNLPRLMVAQEIVGVDYATSGTFGHFDAIVQVVVQNVGSVDLEDFSLLENLAAASQLGSAFVNVTGAPQIVPVGAHGTMTTASTDPEVNLNYNGTNDLLDDNGVGLLEPGEIFVLQYRIEVNPEAGGAPGIPKLQVEGFGTGDGPFGNPMTVSDASDSGHIPQSTNPGRSGDSGGTNDPTPLTNCGTQIGALSCNNSVQISMNEDCLAGITPSMILEGEFWQCASDDYLPLGAYYEIFMVTNEFGVVIPDAIPATPNVFEIDGSFVGQTLTVKAKDVVNGNACWGNIVLEDKLGPTFDCPSPIEIDCFESLGSVPVPVAEDNCDPDPEVSFISQLIIDNDICDDGIYRVRRIYTAHDQYGNQAANQCVFEIHLTRPDVTFPKDINWYCEQYANYPNIVEPVALHPIIKDENLPTNPIDVNPTLPNNVLANTGSGTVNNAGGVCAYHVSHSDQTLAACGNTFKIIRTWSVIDWCTGDVITQGANGEDNKQTIKIIDVTAPTISMDDFTVSATIMGNQHQVCRSQGLLPPPDAFDDNCQPTSELYVQIITSIGEADYLVGNDGKQGGLIPAPGLTVGVHNIIYRVTDDCGNTDSVVVQATVVDDITPTAVCDELTEANLNTSGYATVFAETFDDGSHDNCCLIGNFQARRMTDPCDDGHDDTVFGPSVTFCCEDVGTGPHMVVFRVFDCVGNFNDCMVEVVVNDKQEPLLLHCPSNARMTCNDYTDDFETQLANLALNPTAQNELFDAAFGTALFQDNCAFSVNKNISVNLTQCLEGSITRTWTAVDPGGLTSQSCSQTIFVDHVSDWVVEFAPDVTISCGQTVPAFVEPEIFFEDCEMVGISYDDVTSTVVQDACFKIERTWVVINWCVLGALTDEEYEEMPENQLGLSFPACDLDGDGDCDGRTFRDSWGNGVYPDASIATQTTGPDTDPDTDPWDGYIAYTQTIKATDEVDPVFVSGCGILDTVCIENTSCVGIVTLTEPTVDDCSPMVTISASSNLGSGFGPFNNVPPGTYNITFTAMDNCNNQSSCQASVTVVDCKKPTAFCKPGLIVGIMATVPPMITVVADSLDDGSFDNCPGELTFSFSSDVTDNVDTFFCFNVGENEVEIWVTDASGNQDFCTTTITVQDGMNNCDDDPIVVSVAGVIDTELGAPVEGVNISVSGQFSDTQTTPLSGDFSFANVPQGNDVTITPTLNDDPLNGVTTFDLVLITQHILGTSGLDSPYKMIAADANNSGSITTFDMLTIRKLILFIEDEFPNNSSWRFVDKNFVFPNGGDPWATPFPEVISINDIPTDVLDADFVAIKVGDVNGSAATNLLGSTDDRSPDETFFLHAEERNLTRGEKFNLALSAKEMEVNGFQFTLQFDPAKLEFLSVENGQLEANNFGFTFVDEGYLTVSWNGELREDFSLTELRFRALDDLRLGNAIQVNSRYTQSEAYRKNGEMMDVQIQFTDGDVAGHFELYQNVPNPFSDATIISFHLPRASMASLTISDVQGRTVRTVTDLYEAGYNEIELGKDQLPSNGIFYYRLETPTDSDTKTMIMLE